MKTIKKTLPKNFIFFWFLFGIALIKSSLFSHLGFGLLDEGESLHNAVRILEGGLPYKDFFAIFPPLDNYIFAIIFGIFGKSVLLPRLLMSFVFSFAPPIMFLIISKYSNKLIALVFSIIIIFIDLNVERLYIFTPIFAALYLFEVNIFLSGVLLGLISLIRFDLPGTFLVGMLTTLVIQLFDKVNKVKTVLRILKLISGYSLPIILGLIWMWEKKILNLFFKSTIQNSVLITKLHHIPAPSIVKILPKDFNLSSLAVSYESFYFYLVIGILCVSFFVVVFSLREIIKNHQILLVIIISGILSIPYVFGRTDMGHVVKGTMPSLFLLPYLLKKVKVFNKFKSAFLLIIFAFVIIPNLFQSIWWIRFNDTNITIGGYKLRINSKIVTGSTVPGAFGLKNAVQFLEDSSQNEKVLALPYLAGVYFLSSKNPPGMYNNLLAGFITTDEDQEKYINLLRASEVKKVVYARYTGPKMFKNKLFEYNSRIDEYIMKNYKIVDENENGWLLMVSK